MAKHVYIFSIADFFIKIQSLNKSHDFVIPNNFIPFLCNYSPPHYDLTILIETGYPPLWMEKKCIFAAQVQDNNPLTPFWEIYQVKNHYLVATSHPEKHLYPYRILAFCPESFTWRLYIPNHFLETQLDPLIYPMGHLILYYLLGFNNSIMLHASGIVYKASGLIFSGVSGVGKSTMARLWENYGAQIINDDRLIIRKQGEHFFMYNSPMLSYADKPVKNKIGEIFFIYQNKKNQIQELSTVKSVAKLMACTIQHAYSKQLITSHMNIISILAKQIKVYTLGFKPEVEVIHYILNH